MPQSAAPLTLSPRLANLVSPALYPRFVQLQLTSVIIVGNDTDSGQSLCDEVGETLPLVDANRIFLASEGLCRSLAKVGRDTVGMAPAPQQVVA